MDIVRTMMRILRPALPESPVEEIERVLAGERRRVNSADPDTVRQWQLLRPALQTTPVGASSARPFVLRPAFAAGLAVVCLAVAAAVLWLPRAETTTYATARGRQTTVLLPDSSEVTLNHTTSLQVRSVTAHGGRAVTLDGEAFFRVRKTGSPFVVTTSTASVEVLGTAFNLRARDGVLELTVVEGRVRLQSLQGALVVGAGEIASCSPGSTPQVSERRADPDAPGWIHGKYLFDRATLASVCREFEETFDVRITLQRPDLAARSVTGTVEARTPDAALATIAQLAGARFSNENGGYILY